MASKSILFKSCFITEVEIDDKHVLLSDSSGMKYFIMKDDADVLMQFKGWFSGVFLKCIPQSLTVLKLEIEEIQDEDGNKVACYVVKQVIFK